MNENEKEKNYRKNRRFEKYFNQMLLFGLLLILGIALTLQMKSIEQNRRKEEAGRADYFFYFNLLESEKKYTEEKIRDLQALNEKKDALLEKALMDSGESQLLEEFKRISLLAGFTEIRGAGVLIILDDQMLNDPSYPPHTSAIHDADIRHVVDILRNAGAHAIAVNGERIVSTSELTCNGPTVQVNKKKFPVPYEISAIGDVINMITLIETDDYLKGRILSNIRVSLEVKQDITINGFSDTDNIIQYIDALKEGEYS
jgi:uncharacterized protein YlxW (UPF0749 family)